MTVQIHINGDNAEETIQEFATLSAAFVPASTSVPTKNTESQKEDKPKKQTGSKPKQEKAETKQDKPEEKSEPKEAETDSSDDTADSEDIPTDVELRAKAQEVGKKDPKNKPKIKALLDEFECKNITSIPEDKRIEFMAALEVI